MPPVIDWTNPKHKVSKHFTVKESIYLPTWGRLATEADGLNDEVKNRIIEFMNCTMDVVRDMLGMPVIVHCTYRPVAYNALPTIAGAPGSAHLFSGPWGACDFHAVVGIGTQAQDCDHLRQILRPWAPKLFFRLEDRPGSTWVHVDSHPVGPSGNRYFKA